MLIIGDIAGQYATLLALLKQCPDDEPVSVGDMIDRGPDSKRVLDFFMRHGRAVLGNHEAMMLQAFASGHVRDFQDWAGNGGGYTLRSFDIHSMPVHEEQVEAVDPYLEWIDRLPLFIREPGLIVTHAPIPVGIEPDNSMRGEELDLWIWNRNLPERRAGEFQVYGHNSYWGLKYQEDYAVCIDTSQERVLTALQWPSMKVFQQPYL